MIGFRVRLWGAEVRAMVVFGDEGADILGGGKCPTFLLSVIC